nr:energy-coupling factor transporter transmembrane component T [Candidatus Sigynarchaeota archaeon]
MSINLLKGFEFKKKNTFLHSLDPRTKLFMTLVYSILALAFSNPVSLVFFLLTLVPFIISGRIVGRWLTTLKGLAFLVTFILIINTWLGSLDFAISMCLRIILLVSAFSLFFMTVHPDELASSLLAMHVPFSFTFTLSLATRFMPTLALEAQSIIDAQRSRGLELEQGGIIARVKNMVPILVPLIINSIKRAFSVAEALESKAFGTMQTRTNYFEVKMHKRDYIVIFLISCFVAGFFILFFSHSLPSFFFLSLTDVFPHL